MNINSINKKINELIRIVEYINKYEKSIKKYKDKIDEYENKIVDSKMNIRILLSDKDMENTEKLYNEINKLKKEKEKIERTYIKLPFNKEEKK